MCSPRVIKVHEYRVDLTPEGSTARRGLATAISQEFGPIWRSANGQLGKSCATVQVRIQNRSAQRKLRVRMPPASIAFVTLPLSMAVTPPLMIEYPSGDGSRYGDEL